MVGQIKLNSGIGIQLKKGFMWFKLQKQYKCNRCGSDKEYMYESQCFSCGQACLYCENCIILGRSRYCTPLIQGIVKPSFQKKPQTSIHFSYRANGLTHWNLSEPQSEAVQSASTFLHETRQNHKLQTGYPPCFLIWAVTARVQGKQK